MGVNPAVASLLIGPGGNRLEAMEKITGKTIFIRGQEGLATEDVKLLAVGELSQVEKAALPVREARS